MPYPQRLLGPYTTAVSLPLCVANWTRSEIIRHIAAELKQTERAAPLSQVAGVEDHGEVLGLTETDIDLASRLKKFLLPTGQIAPGPLHLPPIFWTPAP